MTRSGLFEAAPARQLHHVLILADESAHWKVAGLRQLDRLLFMLRDFARRNQSAASVNVSVVWDPTIARHATTGQTNQLRGLELTEPSKLSSAEPAPDLVLNTRLFLYRDSLPLLLAAWAKLGEADVPQGEDWQALFATSERAIAATLRSDQAVRWEQLASRADIPDAERRFLKNSGKSQDGLASRYLNRPLSRRLTRFLLKAPVTPSAWSIGIFILPLCASFAFLRGTYSGFVTGCAIFQLYSIIDGCDGEIARAKFLQTEFGRRLDSFCDLLGNMLLALTLGMGLALQAETSQGFGWFYIAEGIGAALLIVLSEGIVFARRSRSEVIPAASTRWNGALYQRHHEFLERSGILFFGERFAWWLVQLTKRDMAMLAFLLLSIAGQPAWILHLLLLVSGVSSALAGNAFLRQPAPALPQEAS